MSFEGFYRILCENGHLTTIDVYEWSDRGNWRCPTCLAPEAWRELIDQTNGYNVDDETPLQVIKKATICCCVKCNNQHVVAPPVYKIPN